MSCINIFYLFLKVLFDEWSFAPGFTRFMEHDEEY